MRCRSSGSSIKCTGMYVYEYIRVRVYMCGFLTMYKCVVIGFILHVISSSWCRNCDLATNARFQEGNLGESSIFSWLGVLRVHLHQGGAMTIAVTGIVLIKNNYAIANADDVARIPRKIFREDSKAMFIPSPNRPWFCKLQDYMTHPEYEFSTYNTLALVELRLDEDEDFPLKPICWPRYAYNASTHLYVLGYTDENQLLEKVAYKLQYVNHTLCEEFYNRAGLSDIKMTPTQYQCGFAANNLANCIWDNGMVLASNSTNTWMLLGFGIRGPGCAAPARFINMYPYFPWIETATSLQQIDDYPDFRKMSKKSRHKADQIQDIPAHALLAGRSGQGVKPSKSQYMFPDKYQFDVEKQRLFEVTKIGKGALQIRFFHDVYEASKGDCSAYKTLVYKERGKIVGNHRESGVAYYKISVLDMWMKKCSCVKLKIDSENRSQARIYFKKAIDAIEGSAISEFGETPEEILKYYPINERRPKKEKGSGPGSNLKPAFIKDERYSIPGLNVNLLFELSFQGEATFSTEMYGTKHPLTTTTPKPKPSRLSIRKNNTKPASRRKLGKNRLVARKRRLWGP